MLGELVSGADTLHTEFFRAASHNLNRTLSKTNTVNPLTLKFHSSAGVHVGPSLWDFGFESHASTIFGDKGIKTGMADLSLGFLAAVEIISLAGPSSPAAPASALTAAISAPAPAPAAPSGAA
ncbi:MAG: hypothetical protein IT558_03425 [Alphaproteobacteria bacterium]|nr:hypothetical protein [Alphaproteobacteria bacterium]